LTSFSLDGEKIREVPCYDDFGALWILANDAIEVRNGKIVTAYSNVACPSTQEIWYTFGGYPAAREGDWQRLDWPW